jgi:hypothetical protein
MNYLGTKHDFSNQAESGIIKANQDMFRGTIPNIPLLHYSIILVGFPHIAVKNQPELEQTRVPEAFRNRLRFLAEERRLRFCGLALNWLG